MILTEEWFARYGELYNTHDRDGFHFEVMSEYYVFLNHVRTDTYEEALELMYDSLSRTMWEEVLEVEAG